MNAGETINSIADANEVLNRLLPDDVLKRHCIDALSNAKSLIITPDGSVPMANAN